MPSEPDVVTLGFNSMSRADIRGNGTIGTAEKTPRRATSCERSTMFYCSIGYSMGRIHKGEASIMRPIFVFEHVCHYATGPSGILNDHVIKDGWHRSVKLVCWVELERV